MTHIGNYLRQILHPTVLSASTRAWNKLLEPYSNALFTVRKVDDNVIFTDGIPTLSSLRHVAAIPNGSSLKIENNMITNKGSIVPKRWLHMLNDFYLHGECTAMHNSSREDIDVDYTIDTRVPHKEHLQLTVYDRGWGTYDGNVTPLAHYVFNSSGDLSCNDNIKYSVLARAQGGISLPNTTYTYIAEELLGKKRDEHTEYLLRGVNDYNSAESVEVDDIVILYELLKKNGIRSTLRSYPRVF